MLRLPAARAYQRAAHHLCDCFAAPAHGPGAKQAAQQDNHGNSTTDDKELQPAELPYETLYNGIQLSTSYRHGGHQKQIRQHHQQHHCKCKQGDQLRGFFARLLLGAEEVHRCSRWNAS